MSSVPPYEGNLSLILSEVLSDVGINEEVIQRRRNTMLMMESSQNLIGTVIENSPVVYFFGSQSEGSTTRGIKSDIDTLVVIDGFHVINDWSYWEQGSNNLIMIQDESTTPGYCLLQLLQSNAPLPEEHLPNTVLFYNDVNGRVLLNNTIFHAAAEDADFVPHGPAFNILSQNTIEHDFVFCFHCKNWPTEGKRWLSRENADGWPAHELKSESEKSGCFLVAVASKESRYPQLEWRISTSLAERYLMFSLNTSQMNCYVLMKMLIKSYAEFHDVISSYMCKTVMFYYIEKNKSNIWEDRFLVRNLNFVLEELKKCVADKNCPHFIIPENNLMAGKINGDQQHQLLQLIQHIIDSDGKVFYYLQIDAIGERLKRKLHPCSRSLPQLESSVDIKRRISGELCHFSAKGLSSALNANLKRFYSCSPRNTFIHFLYCFIRLNQDFPQFDAWGKGCVSYTEPMLCSTIGSLMASYNTALNRPLPDIVFQWLKKGVHSDVTSGWLKLATVYFSIGYLNETEKILSYVEQRYNKSVVLPICGHKDEVGVTLSDGFDKAADQSQVGEFRHIISYCVVFMRGEVNIVPPEMKQEYSRSTEDELQLRHDINDKWMNFVEVDSLPYLYFLQYKTYKRLGNREKQERALQKLKRVIQEEPNLSHKETALNILGQCMEQENQLNEAFDVYERSLQVRSRNNAANEYKSKLLFH